MKLAIMQPYLFPYIGYFQLISSVNTFVIYDDVNFIKGGWINRNNFLHRGEKKLFTMPLSGASPNKKINEIEIQSDSRKFLQTIRETYGKAKYFNETFPLVEEIMTFDEKRLSLFLEYSLFKLIEHVNINVCISRSSSIEKNSILKGVDKVIEICRLLNADTYINAIGGQHLYDKNDFLNHGIDLKFILTDPSIQYPQQSKQFISNLSIVDILMHVGRMETQKLLTKYTLV